MNTETNNSANVKPAKTPEQAAMEVVQGFCFGYTAPSGKAMRLVFTPQGQARLGQIMGWIWGLYVAGQQELAAKLAIDLLGWFDYLAEYGGQVEIAREGKHSLFYPKWKVSLADDGTFGGFGLAWFRAIPNKKLHEVAEAILAQKTAAGEYDPENPHAWTWALEDARKQLRINKDLEELRYVDQWNTEVIHYGYDFNGGMIYHGPGRGETFTVSLGQGERFWGIHT